MMDFNIQIVYRSEPIAGFAIAYFAFNALKTFPPEMRVRVRRLRSQEFRDIGTVAEVLSRGNGSLVDDVYNTVIA